MRAGRRAETRADFEEFAIAQTPALLALGRAMTGSSHDAWDLVQETLARMAERWERVDSPPAYARTVMARLNVDRIRRLRREIARTTPDLESPALADSSLADSSRGDQHSGELDGWLLEALRSLSPQQRTVLALRYVDDLSVAQIADRVGSSEGTVKSQLSRGVARLRGQLPTAWTTREEARDAHA